MTQLMQSNGNANNDFHHRFRGQSVPIRGHEGRSDSGAWATVASWTVELPPDTPGLALVSDMIKTLYENCHNTQKP